MAQTVFRSRRAHRLAFAALSASTACLPGVAWAQCVANGPPVTTVSCTGSVTSYSLPGASGVTVSVASGATITAPLVIGTAAGAGTVLTPNIINNAGIISGSTAISTVQMGDYATVNNATTGTISSTGSTAGSAAITLGNYGTVDNSGTLTAVAGFPAVTFGAGGTFINEAAAPAAISGNINFGVNTGSDWAHFTNLNTAFGITGNVTSSGNTAINNEGLWTGNFTQSTVGSGSVVNVTNGVLNGTNTSVTFTGVINTQDTTTLTNNTNATMYLYQAPSGGGLGTAVAGTSQLINNGALFIGTGTVPAQQIVNGNFVQSATGTLNMIILPAGASVATPGTTYSQIYAQNGTASLNGTLALNVTPGFYPTGSVYQLVRADNGITGNFSSVTGTTLPFITFVNDGVVTISGAQQAYEFTATRTPANLYATALYNGLVTQGTSTTSVVSTNQLSIARGLQPLVTSANTAVTNNDLTNDVITFVGQIDVLTIAQAQVFLDSVSPEGYLAYKRALHDQANAFTRSIDLRMNDQNSQHDEDGWWFNAQGEYEMLSNALQTQGYRTRDNLLGFVGGYDFSGPHHVYGLAMNVSWDALSYAPGTMSGHNRDIAVAGYGAYDLGPVHFTGQVAYNMGHLGANKTITLDTVTRLAHGGAAEHLLKATGTVGLQFLAADYKIEPFVGIDYANGKVNSFTETGAGAADLTVAPISANRNDLLAGVSFTRATGTFRPYLRAAYRSQFGSGGADTVTAYFNGETDSTFTVTGVPEGRHELDANVGANWVFDDAGALFAGYQGTFRTGHLSSGLNVGIRLEF